ncbi:PAS domain-containing protein [bacterium]|nr:PAS domain-containing protein [bacterium]
MLPVFHITPDAGCIHVNESWIHFTGLSWAQSQAECWLDAFHLQDVPLFQAAYDHAREREQAFTGEYRLCHHDGQYYRTMLITVLPVATPEQPSQQWVGSCVDITDRKTLEARLIESEERLRLAVDAMQGLVYDWDLVKKPNLALGRNFLHSRATRKMKSQSRRTGGTGWFMKRIRRKPAVFTVMPSQADSEKSKLNIACVIDRGMIYGCANMPILFMMRRASPPVSSAAPSVSMIKNVFFMRLKSVKIWHGSRWLKLKLFTTVCLLACVCLIVTCASCGLMNIWPQSTVFPQRN